MALLARLVTLAILITATAARAGTPLPAPFSVFDGGFVPPDAATAKSTLALFKATADFATRSVTCYAKAEKSLAAAAPADLTTCLTKVEQKFDASAARLNLPACVDATAIRTSVAQVLAADMNPLTYCDGPIDPGTGLRVATSATAARGEIEVAKLSSFAYGAQDTCFYKYLRALAKGINDSADVIACSSKLGEKWSGKRSRLYAKGLPPACVDIDTSADIANLPVGAFFHSGDVFCASPSGAFLE